MGGKNVNVINVNVINVNVVFRVLIYSIKFKNQLLFFFSLCDFIVIYEFNLSYWKVVMNI
jgi:hypothetical protein